jgi:hypothetical protein
MTIVGSGPASALDRRRQQHVMMRIVPPQCMRAEQVG